MKHPAQIITRAADLLYFKPLRRFIPHDTFLYFVCGAFNMVFGWGLYALIFNIVITPEFYLHVRGGLYISPHILTLFTQFPITFIIGFWLNRYVVFKYSDLSGWTQISRYLMSVLGAFAMNYLLLKLFVEIVSISATPSKMLTDIMVTIYSYLMQKHFSFRTKKIPHTSTEEFNDGEKY